MSKRSVIGFSLLLAFLGGLYALVLGVLGAVLCGAGDGTGVPFGVTFSPFILLTLDDLRRLSPLLGPWLQPFLGSLAFGFWPVMAVLARFPRCHLIFYLGMGLHYFGVPWCVVLDDHHLERVLRNNSDLILLWGFLYLVGQVGLWFVVVASKRPRPSPPADGERSADGSGVDKTAELPS